MGVEKSLYLCVLHLTMAKRRILAILIRLSLDADSIDEKFFTNTTFRKAPPG